MGELHVIVGMDWLGKNQALIDCKNKKVRIPMTGGDELIIRGQGRKNKPTKCSCAKFRKYLRYGCTAFVVIIEYKRELSKGSTVTDISVICEFPYVFPDDLPGLPPKKEVEFRIDLVPGASPIAKVPYRLAPPKMQELVNYKNTR